MLKTYLISPPFGRWISHPKCTRVKGSYTLKPRYGLFSQIVKTVRPHGEGWINNIGLRNPGIAKVKYDKDILVSVAAIDENDWYIMKQYIPTGSMIEMNFSCPNVPTNYVSHLFYSMTIQHYVDNFEVLSVKLPPTKTGLMLGMIALDAGAGYVHMGNSLPVDRGGYSGPDTLPLVVPMVDKLANEISKRNLKAKVIAGGGIRTAKDVDIYSRAGASHFSMSTAWISYRKTKKMLDTLNRDVMFDYAE